MDCSQCTASNGGCFSLDPHDKLVNCPAECCATDQDDQTKLWVWMVIMSLLVLVAVSTLALVA